MSRIDEKPWQNDRDFQRYLAAVFPGGFTGDARRLAGDFREATEVQREILDWALRNTTDWGLGPSPACGTRMVATGVSGALRNPEFDGGSCWRQATANGGPHMRVCFLRELRHD